LRLTGRDGIARALYVTAIGQRVVVVRAFVKKTQKTPRSRDRARATAGKGDHMTIPFDALANPGHDTRRIQDWLKTHYTQLSAAPFKDFWR
jgi:hypothetical protein